MPLDIIHGDITQVAADAIVNAANEQLRLGGGVCGAIFRAAGAERLQRACDAIGHVDTGGAVATPAFSLAARHVIHTAGPVWTGTLRDRQLLFGCYFSSLELARELGDRSIAFPLVSSGIYGCPRDVAMDVATEAIQAFLADDESDMQVTLVLFDRDEGYAVSELRRAITHFLDEHYEGPVPGSLVSSIAGELNTPEATILREARRPSPTARTPRDEGPLRSKAPQKSSRAFADADSLEGGSIDDLIKGMDASFSDTLLALIDERGLTDAEVYKRANVTRQYFSKIRAGSVNPSKRVVLAFAVALGLDLDGTQMLLDRAGFSLSRSFKMDVIVEYFIRKGIFDIFQINRTLYAYDQPLLGTN